VFDYLYLKVMANAYVWSHCRAAIFTGGAKGPPDKVRFFLWLGSTNNHVVLLTRVHSMHKFVLKSASSGAIISNVVFISLQVFVIGEEKEVRKTEAILRGRML
jgi:hypothetical protein